MNIEQIGKQLQATWPRYPKATHEEIIRRLKSISGAEYDREHRCWWIPPAQGDKLMNLFPRASFSVDAIWLCTDAQANRARTFYDSLVRLHVDLQIDESGAIVAVGAGVSPLIQELVTERADALRPLVAEAARRPERQAQTVPVPSTPVTEDERLGPLFRGIQNAKAKAEVDTYKYPKRRRRAKAR